jgi:imidazolonepropionase-like amidohydrolase
MVVPVRLVGTEGTGISNLAAERRFPNTELVESAEEARSAVRAAKQMGADFIKVHRGHSRETFLAIATEARSEKIPLAGHVQFADPKPDMLRQASSAGIASIEHVEHLRTYINTELGGPDGVGMDGLSASQAAAMSDLFEVFKRNGTWFCPALTDTPRPVPIQSTDVRLKYFDAAQRQTWIANVIPAARAETAQRNYRSMLSFVAAMHKAGVGLLAGTDARREFGMPGFWLHEELKQLVAAGLTPMDALRSATFKPAQFLRLLETLGTIEAGKLSEMALLDANPLEDIGNTTRINMVFTGGRMYSRTALDAMLAAVEKNAQN